MTADTITVGNLVFELYGSTATLADVVDKNVTSIKIPAYVEERRVLYGHYQNIFSQCPNLESIEVEDGGVFFAIDGVLFANRGDEKILVAYPPAKKEVCTIPDGTTSIGYGAFCNAKQLTELTIADSVNYVERAAFHSCTTLEIIHGAIPKTEGALFAHCNALKQIEFAELEDVENSNESVIPSLEIIDCSSLEEVVIPKSREIRGQFDIVACPNLKKLVCLGDFHTNGGEIEGNENTVVYGYESNGVLRKICSESGVTFIPIEYQAGDINGNDTIDIVDVLALNQYLLSLRQLDEAGLKSADVDNNGKVDDADAIKILKSLVGLETLG